MTAGTQEFMEVVGDRRSDRPIRIGTMKSRRRKGWIPILVAVLLLFAHAQACAEGNCPQGYYPIGGQGVQGCAPIPGGAQPAPQGAAQEPEMRWEHRWGAVAHSEIQDVAGVAKSETSRQAAESRALDDCAQERADDCRLVAVYANACVAWVLPRSVVAGSRGGIAIDLLPGAAMRKAQANCLDPAGKGCTSFYEDCSTPMRTR